jgi:hypothetical protein
LIATVPTTFAVLEDAVATSRKCHAGFVPGGGVRTAIGFAGTVAVAVALTGAVAFAFVCANVVGTGAGLVAGDVGAG